MTWGIRLFLLGGRKKKAVKSVDTIARTPRAGQRKSVKEPSKKEGLKGNRRGSSDWTGAKDLRLGRSTGKRI